MKRASFAQVKDEYFRRLNEIHIAAQLAAIALEYHQLSMSEETSTDRRYRHFSVPAGPASFANIRRSRRDVRQLIAKQIATGGYEKALSLTVSITEDYFSSLLTLILRAYPERLTRGRRGGEATLSIPLADFVSRARDDLIDELIRERVNTAMHGLPSEYLSYLSSAVQVEVDDGLSAAFVEIKATRDLIVHAGGVTNVQYLEKSGVLARAVAGQDIIVDRPYFDMAIGTMKLLIGSIHDRAVLRYGKDDRVTLQSAAVFS